MYVSWSKTSHGTDYPLADLALTTHAHCTAVQGEPYTSAIRAAIRRRYSLLPYWYTLFRQAYLSGAPPMRYDDGPLFVLCNEPPLT